jgi:cbb3-type cytochrome c oxidase subunit III
MIDSRILVGLLAMLIAVSGVVYIGIGELDRQAEYVEAFHGRSIESGAAIFTEYCSPCHGLHGEGIPGVAPNLNSKYFFEQRLKDIGFQGSIESYIRLTVAAGRPVKTSEEWPRNMPTWSVDYGGPLRNDQIDNIVTYIMNWQEGAPDLGDPNAEPTPVPGDTPEERGKNLFTGMGCVGCHAVNGQGGAGAGIDQCLQQRRGLYSRIDCQPNAVIAEGFQSI